MDLVVIKRFSHDKNKLGSDIDACWKYCHFIGSYKCSTETIRVKYGLKLGRLASNGDIPGTSDQLSVHILKTC